MPLDKSSKQSGVGLGQSRPEAPVPVQKHKILIGSHAFAPSVGGIETMSLTLARGFAERGHDVVVVTATPDDSSETYPFKVLRAPTRKQLFDAVRWCDVFFQNNVSLQTIWPNILLRKPLVIAHHTWINRPDGRVGLQDKLKKFVIGRAVNISVSGAIANHIGSRSVVINNCYQDNLFVNLNPAKRPKDLVFLGRLVSDKGVDILLQALAQLKQQGVCPTLTIIGTGTDEATLRSLAIESGIEGQVSFVGAKRGTELVNILNDHKIMVVPSRWNEPFGIVALEGIACGCAVIGSDGGGLKDAIGACGVTFKNGDVAELASAISSMFLDQSVLERYTANREDHIAKFSEDRVVNEYLDVIGKACS